jgi:hypothetical protein
MSYIWQRQERRCLDVIREFFDFFGVRSGHQVAVLMFDGLMVSKNESGVLDPALLRQCEAAVLRVTGLAVQLVEKSLAPTATDLAFLNGPVCLQKLTVEARFRRMLCNAAVTSNLVRLDGWTMVPHPSIPGVYMRDQKAVVWINAVLKLVEGFQSTAKVRSLVEWFRTIDDADFKLYNNDDFDTGIVSFLDGYVDMNTLLFHRWDTHTQNPPLTDHYFSCNLPKRLLVDQADQLLVRGPSARRWCWLRTLLSCF